MKTLSSSVSDTPTPTSSGCGACIPPRNARLTCVSNEAVAAYSGMLPGVLAGQYRPARMDIDLVRLTAAANARLVIDDVTGLDAARQELLFAGRAPLRFDVLSIVVGSVPA